MGYRDVYGQLPPATQVHRVRAYLIAKNEYEYELYQQQQEELDEIKRKNASSDSGDEQSGHRISVGSGGA